MNLLIDCLTSVASNKGVLFEYKSIENPKYFLTKIRLDENIELYC